MKNYILILIIALFSTTNGFANSNNHDTWNNLLNKYVSSQGNVDYKGFKTDTSTLNTYLKYLSNNKPSNSDSKEVKLAYWINAYNAFTVKLIIDNYPVASIKDLGKPWDKKFINIGGETLSLNDIEHNILRKMDEPRIHFAIVCASVSCPKLINSAFTAKKLEEQLTIATQEFLADTSKNIIKEKNIKISKIFKWFENDFKTDGSVIDFINQYSKTTISKKAKTSYTEYNWNLNE